MNFISLKSLFALFAILFIVSCKKDCPKSDPLIVDAGLSQQIKLPTSSATLSGAIKSGSSNGINYTWLLVSGPNQPEIVNKNSLISPVNKLIAGTYIFQFQATNSDGQTGIDTTSVVVTPRDQQKLTLQPANNLNEALFTSNNPTLSNNGLDYFWAGAWTIDGSPVFGRFCIKFDLSTIPSDAIVDSAKFSLFATNPVPVGNKVDAHFGSSNTCVIQRITSNWSSATASWNNQPNTTTASQAVISQSTSSFQDLTNLDITALAQDMVINGNYGFLIKLQQEDAYNIRQYYSSYTINADKRPTLLIYYH